MYAIQVLAHGKEDGGPEWTLHTTQSTLARAILECDHIGGRCRVLNVRKGVEPLWATSHMPGDIAYETHPEL